MIVNDIMEREDEAMEGDEEVMEKNGDVMKNDGDVMENEGEAMMQDDSNDVVKTISIVAKQWEFIPSTIEVSKGDTVKLVIESVDVSHGISLPQFGVSAFLSPGNVTEVEFIADKAGTFAFFCNVQCGRGHGGMRGTLIVN